MTVARLVFGLSADPVHSGHLQMVTQSATHLIARGYSLAEILLVPVYRRNPVGDVKERLPGTYAERFAMCALAAEVISRRLGSVPVRVSDVEAELARHRSQPNYTAETLLLLQRRFRSGTRQVFLISSELVSGPRPQLGRWYRPDRILALADLAICPRPGYPLNRSFVRAMAQSGARVILLPQVETPAISSTRLRRLLRAGYSPVSLHHQGLLPAPVASYLLRHNLYLDENVARSIS
ncbi:MAG: nicotinate-nicotinamide nucleotide adenylyltransferase [Anaerolineae bacterium]